jgi:hypothetical protein
MPCLPELRIDQRLQLMLDLAVEDDADEHLVPDLAWFGISSLTSPPRRPYGARPLGDFGVDHALICFACFIE